ncbi:MAG: hypothetical protein ACODAF_09530 [Actinomycetota bacterium]
MTASSSTSKTDEDQEPGQETDEAATAADEEEVGDDRDGPTDAAATEAEEDLDAAPADMARSARFSLATGAAAVVGAGLGVASLTGTWLSDSMSARQELIGQLNTGQTAPPSEQIAAIYGSPAHTTALFNGFFALAAVIVTGVVLLLPAVRKRSEELSTWVRAVAFGGLTLGALGLVIAGVMWFDVFTDLPTVPGA